MKDYVDKAIEFAEEAVADVGRRTTGKWIQLAAKRFLEDLERVEKQDDTQCPFYFDREIANTYCEFIESLHHVEGKWSTPTITLIPAQMFFVVQLFGFRNQDGGRRFTTALYCVARKNAKSTLAAAIIIACFVLEDEEGPQAISAATTGSQARIVWGIAKRMIEKDPDLMEAFRLKPLAHQIKCGGNGGTFKPINAKASTQDGLNPSYTNLDEVHAHKTSDLLNVLMSAAGARANPLWLYTTTEGYESPGPWPEQRNFAEQILERVVEADHYLAVMFRIDDEDDDFDEEKWHKANPLMRCNPLLLKENRKLAIDARSMPSALSEFRIKRLNRRASTATGWVDLLAWRRCATKISLKDLEGQKCWAALDLASTLDMNALRILWEVDDEYFTWGRYWTPEGSVKKRTERNTVPYAAWAQAGWLTVTEGETTDFATIRKETLADYERFNFLEVAYDPWNALQLATELDEAGLPMKQFVQGTKSYNPAMKAFEISYTKGTLKHDGNPVLTWNMANVIARQDINKNLAPDRKNAKEKIDGAVALFMAFGLAEAYQDEYVTVRRMTAS